MTIGPTGKYPYGKLGPHDKGELRLGIAHDKSNVIIDFGVPTSWIAMPKTQAIKFAKLILRHAEEIKDAAP